MALGTYNEHIIPLLAPIDKVATAWATPWVDLKYAQECRFYMFHGLLTSASTDTALVTFEWQVVRATRAEAAQAQLRQQADEQAAIAKAVNEFLQSDLLGQAGSRAQAYAGFEPDANLTVREALERASQRIGERFKNQPLTESAIRLVIGDALQGVGKQAESVPHLLRALELSQTHRGAEHLETLKCMDHLAAAYAGAGELDRALPLFAKLLTLRQTKIGRDDPDTLRTMHN